MAVEIIAAYQTPGRGPSGLAWDGQNLWLSDYREGLIYKLNEKAEVVGTLWCPGNLSGLTWDGSRLWQAILDEGVVRSIDPISTDFDQTLDLKDYGLLSGMAWDGAKLRVVTQEHGDILSVVPDSGMVDHVLSGPVAIGDIDHTSHRLWLSVATPMVYSADDGFIWLGDERVFALIQLDASDGREMSRHLTSSLYTGLAWGEGGTLWLASSSARKLYRAIIVGD